MAAIYFDEGKFVEDMAKMVTSASRRSPALIVVASEREVKTFDRNFKNECETVGVSCMSFADFYAGKWMLETPRAEHIYAFRIDDIFQMLSSTAVYEAGSVKGKKRIKKEEEINE